MRNSTKSQTSQSQLNKVRGSLGLNLSVTTMNLTDMMLMMNDTNMTFYFNDSDPIRCIYLVDDLNASSLSKMCFDLRDDYVLNYTLLSQDQSNNQLFSKISNAVDMDFLWVLVAGFLVFFMQCGFTMLEAGAVKNINVQNILFKNVCFVKYDIIKPHTKKKANHKMVIAFVFFFSLL